jgi:hypothetical protein
MSSVCIFIHLHFESIVFKKGVREVGGFLSGCIQRYFWTLSLRSCLFFFFFSSFSLSPIPVYKGDLDARNAYNYLHAIERLLESPRGKRPALDLHTGRFQPPRLSS